MCFTDNHSRLVSCMCLEKIIKSIETRILIFEEAGEEEKKVNQRNLRPLLFEQVICTRISCVIYTVAQHDSQIKVWKVNSKPLSLLLLLLLLLLWYRSLSGIHKAVVVVVVVVVVSVIYYFRSLNNQIQ